MSGFLAAPSCTVDVYPYEGGQYTITGNQAQLLACQTQKQIRNLQAGSFTLQCAPGGPFGPAASPQWIDILTPMSLVVIAMSRFGYQNIIMIGVVVSTTESETWIPGQGVRRTLQVDGLDFGYFFQQATYFTQAFLQATTGAPLGAAGLLSALDMGFTGGQPPDVVGAAWYKTIMLGIMQQTSFAYQGNHPTFSDLVGAEFDPYPSEITIPVDDVFITADGSWANRFLSVFPYPWYESFVTTAPLGFYGGTVENPISSSEPGYDQAGVYFVNRVNPLPAIKNVGTAASPTLQMDMSLWNALPEFGISEGNFIERQIHYDLSEARNFYIVNPTYNSNLLGVNNSQQIPYTYLAGAWVDVASIHRYGLLSQIDELHWFCDPTGVSAQRLQQSGKGLPDFQLCVSNIALRQISYYEPTPLMMRGSVTLNLRPDILPGTRFTWMPNKNGTLWTHYIDGIAHSYTFGAESGTNLILSRGLPTEVYANTDMLLDIHTGNASRQDGNYVSGISPHLGKPLQPLNWNDAPAVASSVSEVFSKAQAN